MADTRGTALPRAVDTALRELVNALSKAAMYPPGHRFIAESAASLIDRLDHAMANRETLTVSIVPRGLLLDGVVAEPLPGVLRDFAVRMHRRNIATIHLRQGLDAEEVATLLGALGAADADETIGREGLRLEHARVEPMTYDVLTLAGTNPDNALDDAFWGKLVEAAFDRRVADGDAALTGAQLGDAMSERAARDADGAWRVYEALSGFATALTARGHVPGGARNRFVEVLSTLSRATTTRVVSAAPSAASRRRFLCETLELVPPALLMQLLESVAEADGEPISDQLRSLLGKLAGEESATRDEATGGFTAQVLGLVQQWDGIADGVDESVDHRLGLEPVRLLGLAMEVAVPSLPVIDAARQMAADERLPEALGILDDSRNDPEAARTVRDAVLDIALLETLLAQPSLDFSLIERVARQVGAPAVAHLLDFLGAATDRTTRRRLLDVLVRIGPGEEATLVGRLDGASWYLARNILAVLAQFPAITNVEPVFTALSDPELRVRQEALKVLVRQRAVRDRAIMLALASGEESLERMALTALAGECPPKLVASVIPILDGSDPELQVQAIHVLGESSSPLIVPRLLSLVRSRGGFFRRFRLQPKSPVMLAALEVLARRWSRQGQVAAAIQLAARSTDAEVRAAGSSAR